MESNTIGLHDVALYVPEAFLNLSLLVQERTKTYPNLKASLEAALRTTGQCCFRFPSPWEDALTLAAEACVNLLRQNSSSLGCLRFFSLGTETSVDMAKSGSSYVLGMLQKAEYPLSSFLATFQIQQACAGGALAMLTIAGFLQATRRMKDTGIVLASDVARYQTGSTAEVTQGAGACALLLGFQPRLLSFDLETTGFFSKDVDDFFRPLGSVVAKVRGGFSVFCYYEALVAAFEDHCARAGVPPAAELESIDLFVLHVPYYQLPIYVMQKLLEKYLGLTPQQSNDFLEKRGFFAGLEPSAYLGNWYTGSLYLSLAYSLKERFSSLGTSFEGKKVLLASYGSGNTMSIMSGFVMPGASQVVANWELEQFKTHEREAAWQEYEDWLKTGLGADRTITDSIKTKIPAGRFYLERIRKDGYRKYSFK